MKTGLLCLGLMILFGKTSQVTAQYSHNDWSVYFGGINNEYAEEIATDPSGNIIMTGLAKSNADIATPGAHQTKYGGGASDAFVAKYDIGGNLLWSSYLGGSAAEFAYAVSTDLQGNIYIGGKSTSTNNISTPGSHQPVYGGGGNDGFISKFSPDGVLLWSTYFGGKTGDWVLTLANDAEGNVYASGFTGSTKSIATPGAYQSTYAGNMDCYLAKFSPDGQLLWSTYFGGTGEDRPHDVHVDREGNVILAGTTPGNGMTTTGAYQEVSAGKLDAFIAKWSTNGDLLWSTLYGGSDYDRSREFALDDEGNIYMTGFTLSVNGIATPGAYQPQLMPAKAGSTPTFDSYLVKFSPDGELVWGTYLGGSKDEFGRGVCLTPQGNVIVSGVTASTSNIASSDAFQKQKNGVNDAYIASFTQDGSFIGGTYFGGTGSEPYDLGYGPAVATDAFGNIYLAPSTNSSDIPNAKNSFHPGTSTTMYDGVLAHFSAATTKLFSGGIFNEGAMQLYPNPANELATIHFTMAAPMDVTLRITDVSGKVVMNIPFAATEGDNEKEISLRVMPAGTYWLSIPETENVAVPLVVTR
jgi:hypothetical protein